MKTLTTMLMAASMTASLAPRLAHAEETKVKGGLSPQEQVIEMATNGLKSMIEGKLQDLLFPTESIDYDRIKHDMEQVVQQKIMDAEIDKAIGYFASAVSNSATDIKKTDPISDLEETRKQLVHDLSVMAAGQFKLPAIATYAAGAQIEVNILASMLAVTPKMTNTGFLNENGSTCDHACVVEIAKLRLQAHAKHVTDTSSEIVKKFVDAAGNAVAACTPDDEYVFNEYTGRMYVIHHGDQYKDNQTGFVSQHYKDGGCGRARQDYVEIRRRNVMTEQQKQLAWLMTIRGTWTGAEAALKPTMTIAERNALVVPAYKDVAQYVIAANQSCYSLVGLAIAGAPDACKTMVEATDAYIKSGTCNDGAKALITMLGCPKAAQ